MASLLVNADYYFFQFLFNLSSSPLESIQIRLGSLHRGTQNF